MLLQAIAVILTGLLAGEEFVVRYGAQPALRTLDRRAHIQARVALVRSLRIVVPALMLPAVVASVAAVIGAASALRWAGLVALSRSWRSRSSARSRST